MADTYKTQFLTPSGTLFEGDVKGVKVPGTNGSFEMLVNHAPIISTLETGDVRVRNADDSEKIYSIEGGFLEMSNNKLTILAESAEEKEEG